jgi:beta-glucosidase
VIAPCVPASFRFAYSRADGDIADAAAAAAGKAKAVVFVNTGTGTSTTIPNPYGEGPATISAVTAMSAAQVDLIKAVSAANPNTIVVINSDNPIDVSTWNTSNVKAILSMWFAGQEGGTATARILLGQANPSGHTALTWPANRTDTIWAYPETVKLYPGEPDGPLPGHPNVHLERLNYNYGAAPFPPCVNTLLAGANGTTCTNETEGIFEGYRFFDRQGITPAFPFGYGLSYTTFQFSNLKLTPTAGAVDVSFDLKNTGSVAGADAAQVYVGPGPNVDGVQQAVRALRGFERIELQPGEIRHVTIHLDQRSFQYWDEKTQQWVTNWGDRMIWVGDADALANLPLSGSEAPLKTPAEEAADLLALVQGIGPGNSLTAKVKTIQAALAAGNKAALCGALRALANEVKAQTGKKITTDKALALQRQAGRVSAAAGC